MNYIHDLLLINSKAFMLSFLIFAFALFWFVFNKDFLRFKHYSSLKITIGYILSLGGLTLGTFYVYSSGNNGYWAIGTMIGYILALIGTGNVRNLVLKSIKYTVEKK